MFATFLIRAEHRSDLASTALSLASVRVRSYRDDLLQELDALPDLGLFF